MIKKFNEYSLNEEIEKPFNISDIKPYKHKIGKSVEKTKSPTKLEDFYDEMKKIVNYDEDEYDQGDEPTRSDLASEVGDLMDEYELTTDDLQSIVDKYPNDIDVEWYVKPQLDYELKQSGKNIELLNVLKTYGITDVDNFYRSLNKIGYRISLN